MIPIDDIDLSTDNMTKHCNNFLEFVEAKNGNDNQPLFGGTDKDRVYYSAFGVTNDAEDNMLPYG